MRTPVVGLIVASLTIYATASCASTILLYDQDFESPSNYSNDGGDVNIFDTVNDNYGGQPTGFEFAQAFTVETLNVSGSDRGTGTAAFGIGWSDPIGRGGNYAIGMLSDLQNDLLGLSFNVGDFAFLNFSVDVSSIDLSTFSGPFVPDGAVPEFQFRLYDNPTGANAIGSGTVLDEVTLTGTASDQTLFDWTNGVFGLSTDGNTNGNVILQIDLLSGGYAAFDNLRITASDTEGDVGGGDDDNLTVVSVPAAGVLFLTGLTLFAAGRRRVIS